MKPIPILLLAIGLFASCSKTSDEPSIVFEGEFWNIVNSGNSSEQVYQNWSFLQPQTTTTVKSKETKTFDGNEFKDFVKLTIKGNNGVLVISSQKQEITNTCEYLTRTLTFHEGIFQFGSYQVTVTQNGIFVDGELKQELDNFQLTEEFSTVLDSQTKEVQTTFTGETKQANLESFTVSRGEEEYKLNYLSNTAIQVYQTKPINREIGTIDRN